MRRVYRPRYDAHAAREADFEREYLKHITAHADIKKSLETKFAWIPTRMNSGLIIWLKSYIIEYTYVDLATMDRFIDERYFTHDEYIEAKLKGEVI